MTSPSQIPFLTGRLTREGVAALPGGYFIIVRGPESLLWFDTEFFKHHGNWLRAEEAGLVGLRVAVVRDAADRDRFIHKLQEQFTITN